MKYGQIIKYGGKLGTIVTNSSGKTKYYFLPPNYGLYSCSLLEEINEKLVEETTVEDKVDYLKKDFNRGTIINTHVINNGEFIIIEAQREDGSINFSTYLNFKDQCNSFENLDSALIGLLVFKHQGKNSRLENHIPKLLF